MGLTAAQVGQDAQPASRAARVGAQRPRQRAWRRQCRQALPRGTSWSAAPLAACVAAPVPASASTGNYGRAVRPRCPGSPKRSPAAPPCTTQKDLYTLCPCRADSQTAVPPGAGARRWAGQLKETMPSGRARSTLATLGHCGRAGRAMLFVYLQVCTTGMALVDATEAAHATVCFHQLLPRMGVDTGRLSYAGQCGRERARAHG